MPENALSRVYVTITVKPITFLKKYCHNRVE